MVSCLAFFIFPRISIRFSYSQGNWWLPFLRVLKGQLDYTAEPHLANWSPLSRKENKGEGLSKDGTRANLWDCCRTWESGTFLLNRVIYLVFRTGRSVLTKYALTAIHRAWQLPQQQLHFPFRGLASLPLLLGSKARALGGRESLTRVAKMNKKYQGRATDIWMFVALIVYFWQR